MDEIKVQRRILTTEEVFARLRGIYTKLGDFDAATAEGYIAALEAQLQQARDERDEARRLAQFDLAAHIQRQREWSAKTYGPGPRPSGIIDHIRKKLVEIEQSPADVSEWIDVIILAIDGATRAGHSPQKIVNALVSKQIKNEARVWPDWRTVDRSKAICHIAPPEVKP